MRKPEQLQSSLSADAAVEQAKAEETPREHYTRELPADAPAKDSKDASESETEPTPKEEKEKEKDNEAEKGQVETEKEPKPTPVETTIKEEPEPQPAVIETTHEHTSNNNERESRQIREEAQLPAAKEPTEKPVKQDPVPIKKPRPAIPERTIIYEQPMDIQNVVKRQQEAGPDGEFLSPRSESEVSSKKTIPSVSEYVKMLQQKMEKTPPKQAAAPPKSRKSKNLNSTFLIEHRRASRAMAETK